MKPLDSTGLKRLHRSWRQRTGTRAALILDGVQSPFNVGTIVRTAAAYRVEHLWLTGTTPAPTAAGARKAAMGCERYLTWAAVTTGADAVGAAHDLGYRVLAVELTDDARPFHEVPVDPSLDAVALVVGNEDHGVARNTLAVCDGVVYLPQVGRVGSLNVATAAAIALYELRRREWTA